MKNQQIFFPNLDGLRFIAFFMVFVWHGFKDAFDLLQVQNPFIHKFFYLFLNGKTGVSIFFVLSGFLITYLILAEIQAEKKLDVWKFYLRRSLRIWPLYFLVLLLIFFLLPVVVKAAGLAWVDSDMRAWYYFLFLSNFDVLHIYLVNGKDLLPSTVTWSVAIEEQFYLVWPLFFVLLPSRWYAYLFPVLLTGSYVFRSFYPDNAPVRTFHTLSVMGDLALGGWAAYLSFTRREFVAFFKRQTHHFRLTMYASGLLLIYLLQFVEADLVRVYSRLVQILFFTYIILDQNFSRSKTFKFGNNRFISFWGRYTYGLYLWHPLMLMTITLLLTKFFHLRYQLISTQLLGASIALLLSFVTSYYSYHWFELYFLQLKRRFTFRPTSRILHKVDMLKH